MITVVLLNLFFFVPLQAQQAKQKQGAQWTHTVKKDAIEGTSYDWFVLSGRYLDAPRYSTGNPYLGVTCAEGKVKTSYIFIGAILENGEVGSVRARWDDEKDRLEVNGVSTDYQSIFFGTAELQRILKSKIFIVGIDEWVASEITIQFKIPSSNELLLRCGKNLTL